MNAFGKHSQSKEICGCSMSFSHCWSIHKGVSLQASKCFAVIIPECLVFMKNAIYSRGCFTTKASHNSTFKHCYNYQPITDSCFSQTSLFLKKLAQGWNLSSGPNWEIFPSLKKADLIWKFKDKLRAASLKMNTRSSPHYLLMLPQQYTNSDKCPIVKRQSTCVAASENTTENGFHD